MVRPLALCLAAALVAACGNDPPPKAPDAAKTAAPAPKTTRTASEALQKRWAVPAEAPIVAYVDLARLESTALWKQIAPKLFEDANKDVPAADRACLETTVAAARELALGEGEKGLVAVIRVEPTTPEPEACLKARVPVAHPTVIAGASAAFEVGGATVAFEKGFVYFGEPEIIAAAIAQKGTPWPATLSLTDDQAAAFALKGELVDGSGALVANDTRFRLDFDGKTRDERTAEALEREARSLKTDGGRNPIAATLGQHVEVTRTGKDVKLAFALEEPVDKQAADLARVIEGAQTMVKSYLASSQLVEVQEGLRVIVRAYMTDLENAKQKKLVSYPAVPKSVPRGKTVVLTEADWKPWSKLKLSLAETRFQYEIKASKDGQTAEILARGDLNGDGKTSLFRILLKIEGGQVGVNPNVEQNDPLE